MYYLNSLCLMLLFGCAVTQTSNENIGETLLKYEDYIKSSHDLDKSDKGLLKSWSAEFHVSQVNITTGHRLHMTRHNEHSFKKIESNSKWSKCLELHDKEIVRSEKTYYTCETECLRVANTAINKERHAVNQVAKEIRKWRKSYRYLANKCRLDFPSNEDAVGECLVDYMRRDKYDITFQRLLDFKLRSMSELYVSTVDALTGLDEGLKTCLSLYLSRVRRIMDNMNICYRNNPKN